jgi:hypothetical protein
MYLGDKTSLKEEWAGMFSVTPSREKILWRSLKALSGSLQRLALDSSGLRAKRRGTGPLACFPSNMSHWASHSAARTVGTASLGRR